MKICLSCSIGGHLIEIMQLKEFYKDYDHFFLTFWRDGIGDELKNEKAYFITNPGRNIIKFFKNFYETLKIMIKEKPDVVMSTGAGSAIPSIIIGKLMGSKVIFIESFTRIYEPSLSGKIAYYFSDLFFVQWKQLLKKYGKKAIYKGAVV